MPQIGKYWLDLNLYYTTEHTWGKIEPDNKVKVGMDDFGQKIAGKIMHIRLYPAGKEVVQNQAFGSMETAKWTGKLATPVSGKISSVNKEMIQKPSLINEDPYGKGWLIIIEPKDLEKELKNLITGDRSIEWLKKEIVDKVKDQ